MDVFMYQAALYCAECGEAIREDITKAGTAPADPDDESSYDSDDFPKGPYPDGGGESDSPSHCDHCGAFLENPLTEEGIQYVEEAIVDSALEVLRTGKPCTKPSWTEWRQFYDLQPKIVCGESEFEITTVADAKRENL